MSWVLKIAGRDLLENQNYIFFFGNEICKLRFFPFNTNFDQIHFRSVYVIYVYIIYLFASLFKKLKVK